MTTTPPKLRVAMCAHSEVGKVRRENEDAVVFGTISGGARGPDDGVVEHEDVHGPLLVVCDGLGGAAGGAVASRLAADEIWARIAATDVATTPELLGAQLKDAIAAAHTAVMHAAAARPELKGMATTASVAAIAGHELVVAQVGDSRVYLRRGRHLKKMTRDQSLAGRLVAAGKISESEARLSDGRSVVLQAVGLRRRLKVSLSRAALLRGDRILVCSDGLHDVVGEGAIRHALEMRDLASAADRLISLAERGGAPDNVSVIVADVLAGPPEALADGPEPVVVAVAEERLGRWLQLGRARWQGALAALVAAIVAIWLIRSLVF